MQSAWSSSSEDESHGVSKAMSRISLRKHTRKTSRSQTNTQLRGRKSVEEPDQMESPKSASSSLPSPATPRTPQTPRTPKSPGSKAHALLGIEEATASSPTQRNRRDSNRSSSSTGWSARSAGSKAHALLGIAASEMPSSVLEESDEDSEMSSEDHSGVVPPNRALPPVPQSPLAGKKNAINRETQHQPLRKYRLNGMTITVEKDDSTSPAQSTGQAPRGSWSTGSSKSAAAIPQLVPAPLRVSAGTDSLSRSDGVLEIAAAKMPSPTTNQEAVKAWVDWLATFVKDLQADVKGEAAQQLEEIDVEELWEWYAGYGHEDVQSSVERLVRPRDSATLPQ